MNHSETNNMLSNVGINVGSNVGINIKSSTRRMKFDAPKGRFCCGFVAPLGI